MEMIFYCYKVYGTELEKVEVFNGFQDFVETFYIHRGKVKSKSEEEETIVGEFKVSYASCEIIPLFLCFVYVLLGQGLTNSA